MVLFTTNPLLLNSECWVVVMAICRLPGRCGKMARPTCMIEDFVVDTAPFRETSIDLGTNVEYYELHTYAEH